MSYVGVQFKDFEFVTIEENYYNGYEFRGTFADNTVELAEVKMSFYHQDKSYQMTINPIKYGEYDSYSEKGKGLSTAILVNIISMLQNAEDVTFNQFVKTLVDNYSKNYEIKLFQDDIELKVDNKILFTKDDAKLQLITSGDYCVIYVDQLNVDNDRITYDYQDIQALLDVVNELNDANKYHIIEYNGRIDYQALLVALQSHTTEQIIVVDSERLMTYRDIDYLEEYHVITEIDHEIKLLEL